MRHLPYKRISLISIFCIFLVLFLAVRYQIKPNFQLIYQYLESLSIDRFGTFLDGKPVSLITDSLGKNTSALPAIVILIFSKIININPPLFLFVISSAVGAIGALLLLLSFQKNTKTNVLILSTFLIIVSPIFILASKTSLEPSLLLLFFGSYRYFDKPFVKLLSLLLLLLSSYTAIIFVIILFFDMCKVNKYRLVSLILMTLITIFLALHFSEIVSDYYSILKPESHSFYIGIHKQADKIVGYNFLGKVFYNKYIVISKSLLDRAIFFLDWDFWAFNSVSGKYDFPKLNMVSIFELPFILIGGLISFKKLSREILSSFAKYHDREIVDVSEEISLRKDFVPKREEKVLRSSDRGVSSFLIVIFCLAVSDSAYIFLPIYLTYLIHFFNVGLFSTTLNASRILSKVMVLVLLMIIVISRISILDHAEFEIRKADSRYFVYQEISSFVNHKTSEFILTDRLGLPEIYLTYFNLDYLPSLMDSLKISQVKDSGGFKKTSNIGNIYLTSLDNKYFENMIGESPAGKSYIELEEYLPDFPGTDTTYFNNKYFYVNAEREITTRIKMVNFKK